MKNKQINHVSKNMSKRHGIFTENFSIFFKRSKKWKRTVIQIWQILEDKLLEMIQM